MTDMTPEDDADEGALDEATAMSEFGAVAAWFGSSHDGDRFVWTRRGAPSGPISDAEIDAALASGDLIKVGSTFGDAPPRTRRGVELAWLAGAARVAEALEAAWRIERGEAGEAAELLPPRLAASVHEPGFARKLASTLVVSTREGEAFSVGLSRDEMAGSLDAFSHALLTGEVMSAQQLATEAAEHAELAMAEEAARAPGISEEERTRATAALEEMLRARFGEPQGS